MMTLAYASPEQIRGQNITTASDVYSIGMLLYYLLSGRLPYSINNQDLLETAIQINDLNPSLASQNIKTNAPINTAQAGLKNKLKGELDAILAKTINKEPERRYVSAQQLADDLRRYLNNEPVLAKPDSVLYRMRKFVQRHTIGVMTTVAVMMSLLVLAVQLFNRSQELQNALQATQEEQRRVSQVTEYLIDVFKLSDPLQNQSEIVDVKSLLDHSSQQLENQFNQEPATKAKLYQTLAAVYLNMSDIQAAEKLLQQAKQIEIEGSVIDQITAALIEAELLQKKGQPNEALMLLNGFGQKYSTIEFPVILALKKSLAQGQLMYELGELDAAVETLQLANQMLHAQESTKDHDKGEQIQADIYQLLGNVYWKKGDLEQVEINYQKSFNSNFSRSGIEHHTTLKSLSALGVLAYSQGRFELAKTRFEQVLASRIKQLGNMHYLTADAHNRLGATEYELGHLSAAESHYQQAIQALDASGLRASIKFTRVLNNLGLIKRQQTQYSEAEGLFLQVLDIQTEMLGDDHPDLTAMLNNLGLTAYDQSNFAAALDWFKRAYQVQFDANGLNNANIAFAMTNMGRMYLQLNQLSEAKVWIEQALQLRAEQLDSEHLLYAATLMADAELSLAVKNLENARKSAEQALNIRYKQLEVGDWRLADSRHLWASLNSLSEASKQQMCEDAEIIKQRFGPNHPRTQAALQRMNAQSISCAEFN
jgi:serine/threonine-protein kinase